MNSSGGVDGIGSAYRCVLTRFCDTSGGVFGRERELQAVADFLDTLGERDPAACMLEGEAGIGKTVPWRERVAHAHTSAIRVLACAPAAAEAALSHSALADLLAGIDDVHWLDRPSARVLEFAARRLEGRPIGFRVSLRTPSSSALPLSLDRSLGAARIERIRVGAFSAGALHQLIKARLADQRRPSTIEATGVELLERGAGAWSRSSDTADGVSPTPRSGPMHLDRGRSAE